MMLLGRLLGVTLVLLFIVNSSYAAPYFYFSGSTTGSTGNTYTIDVYGVTDGSTLTAAQTVISFNNSYLTAKSISILSSKCSFWAPADPSLGYGNTPTPYFYPTSNSNEVVLSCGFANPGYTSANATGDLIAKIRFTPSQQGSTSLSFNASETLFRYIGTTINPDTMSSFNITIFESTDSSTPTPTPTSTSSSSGSATPTPTASSSGSSGSSTTNQTTFTDDDLTFVEISVNDQSGSTTTSEDVTLEVVEEDDVIPNAPILEPRPPATPFVFTLLAGAGVGGATASAQDSGEVLAAQSLRELLIPGKSNADKTVVLINLISTITFLALLAVVIWRLITITKMNKLKSKHMKDLLASELAVLESKLGSANPDTVSQIKQEIDETVKKLNKEG